MASKSAGSGAALAVLLAVTGLVVLIGVILLMMWMQPDIEHSPSLHSQLKTSSAVPIANTPVPISKCTAPAQTRNRSAA